MGFGADRFRLLVFLKRATTTASEDDPIIFFIVFDTVCTVPFFSCVSEVLVPHEEVPS